MHAIRSMTEVTRTGAGFALGHHGELLQGMFEAHGRFVRALVTLPCPLFGSRATFRPGPSGAITVTPDSCEKARQAVELTRRRWLPEAPGGELAVRSNMPRRKGLGSSTTDIIAAVRAFCDCHGLTLPASEIARIAVDAEGASDSTMISGRVPLFAQREGLVLENLGTRLPHLTVVGCDTDPAGAGIDTLDFEPARYDARDVATFRMLREQMRLAVAERNPRLLARVAETSAVLNQRHLPTAGFGELLHIAKRAEALGVQVAHSGTVSGLLFRPDARAGVERARRLLQDAGYAASWVFEVR